MKLSELSTIVAKGTGLSENRVASLQRKLQDAGVLPRGNGGSNAPSAHSEHAVKLILAELSGAPGHSVARRVDELLGYSNSDYHRGAAMEFLLEMLRSLVVAVYSDGAARLDRARFAYHSSVTVVTGDHPAIVIRTAVEDGHQDIVFTPHAKPWRPASGEVIETAKTITGKSLFEIAAEIVPLLEQGQV